MSEKGFCHERERAKSPNRPKGKRDFAWHGQNFQIGDFVAILDGQIVAVRNNAADAIAELRAVDPDRKRAMVIEVSPVAADVIR